MTPSGRQHLYRLIKLFFYFNDISLYFLIIAITQVSQIVGIIKYVFFFLKNILNALL